MFKSVDHSYQFGPFRLYPAKRLLTRDNLPVTLASKAFDTLLALVERQGQVLDRDDLMLQAWPNSVVEENNLAQHRLMQRFARNLPRILKQSSIQLLPDRLSWNITNSTPPCARRPQVLLRRPSDLDE